MTATEDEGSELDGENRHQVRYVLVVPPGLAEMIEDAAAEARMLPTEFVRSVVRDRFDAAPDRDDGDDDDEPDDDDDGEA